MDRLRMKASGIDVDNALNDGSGNIDNDDDDVTGNEENGGNEDNGDGTTGNGDNGDDEDFPSLWDIAEGRTEQEGTQQDIDPYEDVAEDFDF